MPSISAKKASAVCRHILAVCLVWVPAAYAVAQNQAIDPLAEQRELYQTARDALASGNTEEYQALLPRLQNYPLLPYLEYARLRPTLAQLQSDVIDSFLERYAGSVLADRLEREWLNVLARQSRWRDFVRYHRPENTTTTLSCQALQARIEQGDDSAMNEVAALWNVGRSQPNACDPLFAYWMEAGHLTGEIAWQRFSKAMNAGQLGLARYIVRQMPQHERSLAELYLRVYNQPERIGNDPELERSEPEIIQIILHGLRRLATIDAPRAFSLIDHYHAMHRFDEKELIAVQRFTLLREMLQGFADEARDRLLNTPGLASETLVSWILRDALLNQDWQRLEFWLAYLPDEARASERWQYWHARALAQKGTDEAVAEAQTLYRNLARTRSFYGFLSADLLGDSYAMVDTPIPSSVADALALYDIPAIVRARELYFSGQEAEARSEWRAASAMMSTDQLLSSGRLAELWGWHRNSIQAMIRTSYWNDLQLRFPLAYTAAFTSAAQHNGVPHQLLMAIARQESAFMHDVRSGAGAMGLMQIMPATGHELARSAGMRINSQDLLTPATNIRLGSRYIAQLLERFDGNRALAAAAYNAGPGRVRQWLQRTAENPLPLDVWVETIPFSETRGYVQNVLAYSVIYGYRLGEPVPLLTEQEAVSRH